MDKAQVLARRSDNGDIQVTVLDERQGRHQGGDYTVHYSGHPQEDLESVVREFSQLYLVAKIEKHPQRETSQSYGQVYQAGMHKCLTFKTKF